jgi:D-citramalate synthase
VSLPPDRKVELARLLDEAGVAVVEAGSVATSPGEREAVGRVADLGLDARVTTFCRGVRDDLDLALECDVDGVNLVVPSSDRHVERKVDSTREEVLQRTVELVEFARDHGLWVEVLGEDGSRADLDFLERLMAAALDAGADRVCFCDTVGQAHPGLTYEAVSRLSELGPTSTHTHDDLGLGVTNALAGVAAGADLVHATVNGVGERAGNAALEEVAVALWHCYDAEPVDVSRLDGLSEAVAAATGVPVPPNKAVSGANAFTHESGIHADGTLKDERMYEPYPPEEVGRERRLVVGKHAGTAGLRAVLSDGGVDLDPDELAVVLERVKERGDEGERLTESDLLALAESVRTAT